MGGYPGWEDDYEDPDDYYDDREDNYYDDREDDDLDFAEPGGKSALRAATDDDPRNQPCQNCGHPNRLTMKDVRLGYQCDSCADACETGREIAACFL